MIQRSRARTTQVADLIAPVDGYRGTIHKKGQKPKNHMSDNAKKIRDAQKEYKMREQIEAEKKREKNFKMKKFSSVKSKVFTSTRPATCKGPRRTDLDRSIPNSDYDFSEDNKENVNYSNIQSDVDSNGDFIRKNIKKACYEDKSRAPLRPQTASQYGGKEYRAKGKVPNYLEKRKEEWKLEEVEKQKEAELQRIPPGTKLLPEDERLATLDQLDMTRDQIVNTLEALPISMRTMSLNNKKLDLESKLKEIDAAIRLFSKENVFVAI
jgi:hypothetical protein